jgi:hypothetical protein
MSDGRHFCATSALAKRLIDALQMSRQNEAAMTEFRFF